MKKSTQYTQNYSVETKHVLLLCGNTGVLNLGHDMTREKKMDEIVDGGFLTVAEVCRLLHFSKSKVYKLVENGDLKGRKFGKNVRISLNALQRFVKRNDD